MAARSNSGQAVTASKSTEDEPFDQQAYAEFIEQIRLQAIWLSSAKIVNRVGPLTPEHVAIKIEETSNWDPYSWGFRATTEYRVRLTDKRRLLATFDATYAVDFASNQPMTDSIFSTFGAVNLPVNTWPYLREFLASALGRMNWTTFTLPALKRGIPEASGEDGVKETE